MSLTQTNYDKGGSGECFIPSEELRSTKLDNIDNSSKYTKGKSLNNLAQS